jgi:hypothetical protein
MTRSTRDLEVTVTQDFDIRFLSETSFPFDHDYCNFGILESFSATLGQRQNENDAITSSAFYHLIRKKQSKPNYPRIAQYSLRQPFSTRK